MNRFFIELYLDEDVDVLVADLLRARGFVATTTRDAGKLQASDAEQMACAVGRQETLLTHNRADFESACPNLPCNGPVPPRDHHRHPTSALRDRAALAPAPEPGDC